MATTRVVTRLLAPKNLHRLSSGPQVRYFWHHHHHRRNVPDINISPVSNFFERWEKEFDRMRQKFNDFVLTESDGSKKFHLSVNVHGFEPEEIKVKTQNGLITISAKKEKKMNNSYALQEFSQTYSLPEEIKMDDLKSTYTENGILSIEAPFVSKDPPKDRQIKIERIK